MHYKLRDNEQIKLALNDHHDELKRRIDIYESDEEDDLKELEVFIME